MRLQGRRFRLKFLRETFLKSHSIAEYAVSDSCGLSIAGGVQAEVQAKVYAVV